MRPIQRLPVPEAGDVEVELGQLAERLARLRRIDVEDTGDDVIVWVPSSGIAREEHSLGWQIEGDTARSVAWHVDDASAAAQIDLIPILQFSIHACRGGRRRRFDSPFMERALDL